MILAYLDPVYIVLFLCFSHSSTIYISRRDRFLKSRFCVSFIFVFQAPSTMHIVVLINIPQMTNSLTTFLEGRDLTCLLLWHAQWRLACVPFLISVNLFISKVFSSLLAAMGCPINNVVIYGNRRDDLSATSG